MRCSTKLTVSALLMATLLAADSGFPKDPSTETAPTIADGMKVTLDYTLILPDQTVLESTVGQEPISYLHGNREILPGLEKAMTGMKAGEKKRITLSPDEAYGPYDEKKKVTVSKDQVPPDSKVGTRLRSPDGREAKIVAMEGNSVVVDLNHPLAGKPLVFEVKIVKVEKDSGEKQGKKQSK